MSEPKVKQSLKPFVDDSHFNIILGTLKDTVSKVLGISSAELDIHTNLFELGLDSLLFIQLQGLFKDKFDIDMSFRQLFENSETINELAICIAQNIPPSALKLESSPQKSLPSALPLEELTPQQISVEPLNRQLSCVGENRTLLPENISGKPTANPDINRLIAQQLQIMSKQLELLRNSPSAKKKISALESKQSAYLPQVGQQHTETSANTSVSQMSVEQSQAQLTNGKGNPKSFVASPRTEKRASGGLSPRQQKHLDSLIARLVKRTQESKRLTQADRLHHANGRAAMGFRSSIKEIIYPIYPERGVGAKIWDIDGNEYIDMSMGFGALLFGHSPSFVIEAVQEHIQQGIQHGPQSRLAGKVAKLICELTGKERATFCNDGTEAVMGAIRIARATTGRSKIAVFQGSYHGTLDEVLVVGIPKEAGTLSPVAIAPGIPQHKVEQVIVLNYGSPQSLDILKAHAHELAAVLVEPVQSAQPDLQPKEFLHELRQLTQETGIVLIFDEMITGFRMHPGGVQALWDVQADITTYGKALGAGLPIGVVAGKAAFMDTLDGGFWSFGDESYPHAQTTHFAGTFFKHPLVMASTWAALNHLKNSGEKLQEELTSKTTKLANTLNAYFEQKQLPIKIIHFGSLLRFAHPPTFNWIDLFFYNLLEKGIYALENRRLFLSTAHTEEDIEQFIRVVKESIVEMQEAGFLPPDPISTQGNGSISHQASDLSHQQTNLVTESSPGSSSAGTNGDTPSWCTVPLVEAQKELWFMAQMGEEVSRAYNQSATTHLRGSFNLGAIHKAIQEVVNRHEALRTTFSPEGNYQRIYSTVTIDIPLIDFSNLENSDRQARLSEFLAQEAQQTFDLEKGPLLRTKIVKLEEQHHLLVLTIHHIIADGWSFDILQEELAAIYIAQEQGIPHQLPQPMQLSQYIQWEARQQESPEMAKAEAYWLEQFANSVPVLELPTDRPRPSVDTHIGTKQVVKFNTYLYIALKNLSVNLKSTLFTTLLTGFMALLHRLTNQDDIVVGINSAGHLSINAEHLIGHYVNLLPIRSQLVKNPTFTEYLSSVKRLLSDAYDHQIYPFIKLVKQLNLPRDPSRAPIVTAKFNLNRPISESNSIAGEIDREGNDTGSATSDISVDIDLINGELLITCEYNTDLFDAQTIQRWMGHWQTLLESVVANPKLRLSELSLLTESEQNQLLQEWNNTLVEYPQQQCIHELFAAQVEKTPCSVAVVFEDQQLTYRELNQRANQLAHYLQNLGVKPEFKVGLCVERSLEMVIGLLAILKAGGAYLPLDPTYPKERLALMLSDSQVSILLTTQTLVDELPEHHAQVVCLDADWGTIAGEREENPDSGVTVANLAYLIYTSGSTGTPKGVLVSHEGLVNLTQDKIKTCKVQSDSRILQFFSLSFDASIPEIVMALSSGAALHLGTLSDLLPGTALGQFLRKLAITHITLPPSALAVLPTTELPNLQMILVGGEAPSMELISQWSKERLFINAYGPTETTVNASMVECGNDGGFLPTIRPAANKQLYILDSNLQPVPIGVPGELHIGGVGLARGYLNRPQKTALTFIPNAFSDNPGERLYKTGDLACYLGDGQIKLLGRLDHQVKIRGFRIEPGEIEAQLNLHPQVQESIVVVREERIGDKQLVAYIVNRENSLKISDLRRFMRKKLPKYMIPSVFVILDSLPLNANGKVDRFALPKPNYNQSEFVAPRNPTEQILAQIFAEVLEIEQVGINDNFFDLGGHSLLITELVSQLLKTLNVEVTIMDLLEDPTVEGLAERITKNPNGNNGSNNRKIRALLDADAILDSSIDPKSTLIQPNIKPEYILLTGATGFVGAFLLYEVLQQTNADVYCLIRANSIELARNKLQNCLESYLLWQESFSNRIIPIIGDLSQPKLGISQQNFDELADKIDVIYHNGAWVNHASPYSLLRATNVLGTQEVLRLACQTKAKPVHFISATSVFSEVAGGGIKVIREDDNIDDEQLLSDGYSQSKWVGEKLVTAAKERGLPVCIYRLARISGHSETGVFNVNDYLYRLIIGSVQLGSIPDVELIQDIIPVDYASKAIVHISQTKNSWGQAFHLTHPQPVSTNLFFDKLRSLGYPIQQIPYEQWHAQLLNIAQSSPEHALYPLVSLLTESNNSQTEAQTPASDSAVLKFDCQNTLDGLKNTSITCPEIDGKLLNNYFSYLINNGFLAAPSVKEHA